MLPHWGRSLRGHKPATKHQPMDERIWTNTTILMNLNDILMDEWLWILIWREMEWNGARQFVNLYLNLNESEQSGDVLSSGLLCCNSASLTITVRVGQLPACQQLFWFYYACRHIMARQPAVIGPLELPPQIELDGKKNSNFEAKNQTQIRKREGDLCDPHAQGQVILMQFDAASFSWPGPNGDHPPGWEWYCLANAQLATSS